MISAIRGFSTPELGERVREVPGDEIEVRARQALFLHEPRVRLPEWPELGVRSPERPHHEARHLLHLDGHVHTVEEGAQARIAEELLIKQPGGCHHGVLTPDPLVQRRRHGATLRELWPVSKRTDFELCAAFFAEKGLRADGGA